MEGGCIASEGNAGDIVGKKMTGGEIIIGGDAGYWVGEGATGGMIRVGERPNHTAVEPQKYVIPASNARRE